MRGGKHVTLRYCRWSGKRDSRSPYLARPSALSYCPPSPSLPPSVPFLPACLPPFLPLCLPWISLIVSCLPSSITFTLFSFSLLSSLSHNSFIKFFSLLLSSFPPLYFNASFVFFLYFLFLSPSSLFHLPLFYYPFLLPYFPNIFFIYSFLSTSLPFYYPFLPLILSIPPSFLSSFPPPSSPLHR